ncbi:MAG: hypothetical protein EOP11_23575 [Proteobacteria bacterium]|nr:MAG: hypothetical protein EOP11_23575 [Pseudomonadota bacterium]
MIAADSVTVYRGLEIGAAKPSAAERARVPHHLLDVADPAHAFTAGDFTRLARPLVEGLQAEGKVPILCGGSGFYLRALLRGMASGEENQVEAAAIKASLEARGAAEGFAGMYAELVRQDQGSVSTVHPNDHYRIVRALQAMALHGRPWSELNKEARATPPAFPGLRFFSLEVEKEELKEYSRWLSGDQVQLTIHLDKEAFISLSELRAIRSRTPGTKTFGGLIASLIELGMEEWSLSNRTATSLPKPQRDKNFSL